MLQAPTTFSDSAVFAMMVVGALLVGKTPLGWPLRCAETFYHEISHGLVAFLTLGKMERITLNFRGGGACTTRGGSRILILMAGYMGASLWGGLLYMIGHTVGAGGASMWLTAELALIAATIVLWCRDISTLIILLVMAGIYGFALWWPQAMLLPSLLKFLGIYVMLNAIRTPFYLIDGQSVGDGADLARIVYVPEFVWIIFWVTFAVLVMLECVAKSIPALAPYLSFLPF